MYQNWDNKYDMMKNYLIYDFAVMEGYLRNGVLLGILVALLYMVVLLLGHKKPAFQKTGGIFLLAAYGVMVLEVAFLSREAGSRQGIDLTLFETWGNTMRDHMYVIENIVMFLPLGILLPIIWKKERSFVTALGTLVGATVCIELLQLITQRGYCQLDDVVMNTLGGLIGYGIYKLAECIDRFHKKP